MKNVLVGGTMYELDDTEEALYNLMRGEGKDKSATINAVRKYGNADQVKKYYEITGDKDIVPINMTSVSYSLNKYKVAPDKLISASKKQHEAESAAYKEYNDFRSQPRAKGAKPRKEQMKREEELRQAYYKSQAAPLDFS